MSKENVAMLKRLEKVEPIYKVSDWIDDWRRKEELTEMITAYPNELQASRPVVSIILLQMLSQSYTNNSFPLCTCTCT